MLTIRDFDYTDADYETLVAVDTIAAPEFPMTVSDWQHADQDRSDVFYHRHLVYDDAQAIGYAEIRQFENFVADRKFFFDLVLLPDHDTPAIHAAYQQHLLAALEGRDAAVLCTGVLSDRETSVNFLAKNGYVEVMRDQFSELDLTTFDAARFAAAQEKATAAGIEIVALPDLQARDPQWKEKLYELDWAVRQDIPAATPPVKPSLAEFERKQLQGPHFYPDCWFIALDGDQYVGESYVIYNESLPETLYTGSTGVIRSHRRKGIATALKLRVFEVARARGFTAICTSNEEHNPMLQLNYAFGFRDKPAWISFEKRLAPAPMQ